MKSVRVVASMHDAFEEVIRTLDAHGIPHNVDRQALRAALGLIAVPRAARG
jgi:hypothetical protein